jgi:phosphatidylinositol alpha-1,6-mannosyltransferase
MLTPDFPPKIGGVQLLAGRLAASMTALEPVVLALDTDGAYAHDASFPVPVERVGARDMPPRVRAALLNVKALDVARRYRPQAALSMHIVASPATSAIRALGHMPSVQYFHAKEVGARPRLAAFAAAHSDAAVAISAYSGRVVEATGANIATLRIITPGVDVPDLAAIGEVLGERPPTILTVARLEERYKGHDVMIDALPAVLESVPDARWVVVGEGTLRGELEQRARERGVADAVTFLGAVSEAERNARLRDADVFAMPSRDPGPGQGGEGFGIVFLEASAYVKPVVAGNVTGTLDAVIDGETGLLVDPTSPEAVAAAIVRLLRDRDLADRLGRAGRERALMSSWSRMTSLVEELLLELIARRAAAR